MPFSTEWVSEGRGVYLAGTGLLTGLLRESDSLKRLHYGLIDLTDVTELRVTRDDVLEFVQVDMQIALIVPRPLAVAIVAPGDLAFGIARMWEAFAEGTRWNTHVFRSRTEADPWLRPWAEGRLPAGPPA